MRFSIMIMTAVALLLLKRSDGVHAKTSKAYYDNVYSVQVSQQDIHVRKGAGVCSPQLCVCISYRVRRRPQAVYM